MSNGRSMADMNQSRTTFFPGLIYLGLIGILVSGNFSSLPVDSYRSVQATPPVYVGTVQPDWQSAHKPLQQAPLPVAQAADFVDSKAMARLDALDEKEISQQVSDMQVNNESMELQPSQKVQSALHMNEDILIAEVGSQEAVSMALQSSGKLDSILLVEPAGCLKPVDDFNRVMIRGKMLNKRTYTMLQYADSIYHGKLDITDLGILQGSYEDEGIEGAGVYNGGGVVDLAVSEYGSSTILYEEIEPLVRALRVAGFAAWFRDAGEVYPGSPAHIHAVAVGDRRLSQDALDQVIGESGYFRGYTGLPSVEGVVEQDGFGGPVVCQWMVEEGYVDTFTSEIVLSNQPENDVVWQERLREVAQKYITTSMKESIEIARSIDFAEGEVEHPANMCGPLAAAILRDADLLPDDMPPADDMKNYWLANPRTGDRPFSLFPDWQYEKYHFNQAISEFDFDEFPLLPADFVYTYAVSSGFDHMFVVTEVDEAGRAYSVTNQLQDDNTYLIERILLYDANDHSKGVLKHEWAENSKLGKTGQGGFAVIRRKGVTLPSGSPYHYSVEAGDTIISVASRFNSLTAAIASANAKDLQDLRRLAVGQSLTVPVNVATGSGSSDSLRKVLEVLPVEAGRQAAPIVRLDNQSKEALPPIQPLTHERVVLHNPADSPYTDDNEALRQQIRTLYEKSPSGDWGIYVEDLDTGMVISAGDDIIYHPASTIKVAVGAAFLHWMDEHPDVKLSNGPVMNQRSYEQLLNAMLIKSEEEATTILIDFLNRFGGYEVQTMIEEWGLKDTTILPRRTKPDDMALLLKRLYRGELLSENSTRLLLDILKTPSNNDDVRLGGGIPEDMHTSLAHKPGTVFDDGWGVVSDIGVLETENGSYVIVALSNFVDWIDYDEAQDFIAELSSLVYANKKNMTPNRQIASQPQSSSLVTVSQEIQNARPQKPDSSSIRPMIQSDNPIQKEASCICQPDGSDTQNCSVKVAFRKRF